MIIQCDKCNSKFRLDDSRVANTGVRVKCTKCGNVFSVMPPSPAPAEVPMHIEAEEPKPEKKPSAKKAKDDRLQEEIDFSSFGASSSEPDDSGDGAPAKPDKGAESDFSSDFFGSALDSLGNDDAGKKKDGDEGYFGGMDFGFDDKKDGEADDVLQSNPATLPNDRSSVFDSPPTAAEPKVGAQAGRPSAGTPSAGAAGAYTKAGVPPAGVPAAGAPVEADIDDEELDTPSGAKDRTGRISAADPKAKDKAGDFSDILASTADDVKEGKVGPFEDAGESELDEDEVKEALRPSGAKKGTKAVVLALIVIIFIGLAYFTGFTGKLTSLVSSTAQATKTFELEGMKGYYVENKGIGKVFAIEAKVRNLTDGFLEVKSVQGAIYGAGGKLISNEKSSPGRLVSADDLKNLGKDDLLKPLRDRSSGLIPPKGTIPVMVVFTDAPDGINEFGLDVIR